MTDGALRRGDRVQVRGPMEILATLDSRGTLSGLPFMPEMASYCGKVFTVDCRTDKLCDTIAYTGSRRLASSVLLEDLRCDGTSHGGCQAECRLYWHEGWLQKVTSSVAPGSIQFSQSDLEALVAHTSKQVRRDVDIDGKRQERWMCQSTAFLDYTERLSTFDPRPYIREYTNGNVSLSRCLRVCARAAIEEPMRKAGWLPEVWLRGPGNYRITEVLNLQPGERVQIKSKDEIAETLDAKGFNRGLWFDREMMAYCGGTYVVRRRITLLIDEYGKGQEQDRGRLLQMKTDAVTLEGVVCSGELSLRRWFCPRQIYSYWRECWLRRVDPISS